MFSSWNTAAMGYGVVGWAVVQQPVARVLRVRQDGRVPSGQASKARRGKAWGGVESGGVVKESGQVQEGRGRMETEVMCVFGEATRREAGEWVQFWSSRVKSVMSRPGNTANKVRVQVQYGYGCAQSIELSLAQVGERGGVFCVFRGGACSRSVLFVGHTHVPPGTRHVMIAWGEPEGEECSCSRYVGSETHLIDKGENEDLKLGRHLGSHLAGF